MRFARRGSMIEREQLRVFPNSEDFDKPHSEKNVWRHQYCPMFRLRMTSVHAAPECFFCKYADFHLESMNALDVGICCYPKIQNK